MSIIKKPFFFYLFLVFTLVFTVNSIGNIKRLWEFKQDLYKKQKELNSLVEENRDLKNKLRNLDEEAMEEMVRNQLRMAKPGETVVVFDKELAPAATEKKPLVTVAGPIPFKKWLDLFL